MKGNEEMSQNHKNINIKAILSVNSLPLFLFFSYFLTKI